MVCRCQAGSAHRVSDRSRAAMDIGGVEGEVDLIDRDAEAVSCTLCAASICLRYPATRVDQEAKDEQAADDPGLTHDRKLSQV